MSEKLDEEIVADSDKLALSILKQMADHIEKYYDDDLKKQRVFLGAICLMVAYLSDNLLKEEKKVAFENFKKAILVAVREGEDDEF